jgi:Ca-activated chloride channel family protein
VLNPLQQMNKSEFLRVVNSFQPLGWTPIAGALKKAREMLSDYRSETSTNLVYIVSDGIETCGGDPARTARELNQSHIQAIVNIIGFDVNSQAQQQLRAVAEAGGGHYFEARNANEMHRVFNKELEALAAYNPYVLCMTSKKNTVYFAYTNKQNVIFFV